MNLGVMRSNVYFSFVPIMKMKKIISICTLVFVSVVLTGCAKNVLTNNEKPVVEEQQEIRSRDTFSNEEKMNIHMCLM